MQSSYFSIKITSLGLATVLLLSACKKDEPEPDLPNEPTVTRYFRWQIDQGTVVNADSMFAQESTHTIFALKNGRGRIEINLLDMQAGSHEISEAKGNLLSYSEGNTVHEASGNLVISQSDASTLSGYFNCNFKNSVLSTITGTFSEIRKR